MRGQNQHRQIAVLAVACALISLFAAWNQHHRHEQLNAEMHAAHAKMESLAASRGVPVPQHHDDDEAPAAH